MKAGTHIRIADGRVGTVVYNGLDGVGIKFGVHHITESDLHGSGWCFSNDAPEDYEWLPDAMLRDSYKGCRADVEYVGDSFNHIADVELDEMLWGILQAVTDPENPPSQYFGDTASLYNAVRDVC